MVVEPTVDERSYKVAKSGSMQENTRDLSCVKAVNVEKFLAVSIVEHYTFCSILVNSNDRAYTNAITTAQQQGALR